MKTIECILNRRSVRDFKKEDIPEDLVSKVLEAGTWAPSGLNNQPWRFIVVRGGVMRAELASLSKYGGHIVSAPVCIVVLLDTAASYHREKDIQAIGACIQNMLLAAHSHGLGAVWIGEIYDKKKEIRDLFGLDENLELMAVVPLGFPAKKPGKGSRKALEEFIIKQV
jgi:nitroreductase